MMKNKVMQMSVAAAVMLTMGVGSVMAVVTADSTTWEGFYEADTKPVTDSVLPGWLNLNGNDNTVVVPDGSNNYINYSYNNDDGAGSYEGFRYIENPGTLDAQTNGGLSLEMRLRVYSGTFFMHFWTSSPGDGRWVSMYVTGENITIRDSDDISLGSAVANTNGPGEWTTIRLTTDDTNWNVYRDNDQSIQAQLSITNDWDAYGLYQMALYGTQVGTNFDLDYMRWTDAGALVVPEPATLAVLGLGGLMLRRRRRNR